MLKIKTTLLARFEGAALSTFEEAMVARVAELSPALAASLGEAQLLVVVRAAIARAALHGFTCNGPVRLFVDLSVLLGHGFDADVQYPWAQRGLSFVADLGEMQGAAALYTDSMVALGHLNGAEIHPVDAGLDRISALVEGHPPLLADSFAAIALGAMERVHPQKCAFVGEPALRSLMAAAQAEAARHGLTALPDVLLVVALMFALGQHCVDDPLYPWIADTLGDPGSPTPTLRAHRLEARARTWRDQVLTITESRS